MITKDQKTQRIQDAALELFSRYGFRRTAMLDIAEAAGISRAALYLYFKNKDEVFRSLSSRLHDETMVAVDGVLQGDGPALDRIEQAMMTFMRDLTAPVMASPHGQELFDANMTLAADITQAAQARLQTGVEDALSQAENGGEIDLGRLQSTVPELAQMIVHAGFGLKHAALPVAPDLATQFALFMRIIARALLPDR